MKILPHDLGAERCLLASLIIDPDTINQVLVTGLKSEMFYREQHKLIFEAIMKCRDRGAVDPVIIANELHAAKTEKAVTYIAELLNETPTASLAEYYAKIIIEKYQRRELYKLSQMGMQVALDEINYEGVREAINQVESQIHNLSRNITTSKNSSIYEGILTIYEDYLDNKGQAPDFLKTGFHELDQVVGGLEKGTHTVIAGRTSMGKTSLALSIALNVEAQGKRPLIFSMEQSKERIMRRLIAMNVPVDLMGLRNRKLTDAQEDMLNKNISKTSQLNIGVVEGIYTPAEIRGIVTQELFVRPVDIVFIDFLTLVKAPESSRKREKGAEVVGEIARELEIAASTLNIPFVTMAQLNREAEKRTNKRPILIDLRASGEIEEYSDTVIFIYREDYYNTKASPGVTELIVAKHRDGPTGTVEILFQGAHTRYVNYYREDQRKWAR